jgi:hypothetical protein
MTTTTLYRALTGQELAFVEASGWREFPPRLAGRPPLVVSLDEAHARKVASELKAANSFEGLGFVARFEVQEAAVAACSPITIRDHDVLQVADDAISAFNAAIEGRIEIIGAYGVQGNRSDILAIKEQ